MNHKPEYSAIALMFVVGCGGSVMAPSKLAASEGSVRGAEEVGAEEVADAAFYLKLAQDEVAKAKTLSANADGDAADRMLERAQVDGDLAIALTRESLAKEATTEVLNKVAMAKKGKFQ